MRRGAGDETACAACSLTVARAVAEGTLLATKPAGAERTSLSPESAVGAFTSAF